MFWVMNFLVAEDGGSCDFGFEGELDKFLSAFALEHQLGAFLVDSGGELVVLGEVKRVRALFEFPAALDEKRVQRLGLSRGERASVQGFGAGRRAGRRHGTTLFSRSPSHAKASSWEFWVCRRGGSAGRREG